MKVLGTPTEAIQIAEDASGSRAVLQSIGEPVPHSRVVSSLIEAKEFVAQAGLPVVVRPAFTLGGTGGGMCETEERFSQIVATGLAASPIGQVLVERSLAGWREVEYEVVRNRAAPA